MQDAEEFSANTAEPDARSYRPETVEVQTFTTRFIEETKGVSLDGTKLRLMKGKGPRGQEVIGVVKRNEGPFDFVLRHGTTVVKRGAC